MVSKLLERFTSLSNCWTKFPHSLTDQCPKNPKNALNGLQATGTVHKPVQLLAGRLNLRLPVHQLIGALEMR